MEAFAIFIAAVIGLLVFYVSLMVKLRDTRLERNYYKWLYDCLASSNCELVPPKSQRYTKPLSGLEIDSAEYRRSLEVFGHHR